MSRKRRLDADTKLALKVGAGLAALIVLGAWYSTRDETDVVITDYAPPEPALPSPTPDYQQWPLP